ncbi:hypothetical protein TNCT_497091 [Trichonephila clavata]|uniref:Uncharacterized protein n=1 Tax=Trichonephila clavata TaxID=2740835 RepID=A0A8X6I910_TRICU|nr:hypothetical protein TNCT_497091 [Trichonephila clavata]
MKFAAPATTFVTKIYRERKCHHGLDHHSRLKSSSGIRKHLEGLRLEPTTRFEHHRSRSSISVTKSSASNLE